MKTVINSDVQNESTIIVASVTVLTIISMAQRALADSDFLNYVFF